MPSFKKGRTTIMITTRGSDNRRGGALPKRGRLM